MDKSTHLQAAAGLAALGAAVVLGGCAANAEYAAASQPEISKAELAIEQAVASDAEQHAGAELTRARTKLANAQAAMRRDETQRAQRLASEALVDAQLAEATAEAEQAESTAIEVQETLAQLREEVVRVRQAQ